MILPHTNIYFLLSIGIVGLLVGSFLNVVIYRLPYMLQDTDQCHKASMNLCFPRSHCPACQTMISAWYNIPLISYIILRGRCHTCQQRISFRYPLVEGLSLVLSVLVTMKVGYHVTLIWALIFCWILLCLAFIDIKHQLLPDCLTLGLLWLGLIANTENSFINLSNAVLSAAGAYLTLWLLIQIYYLCTKKVGMGNGDFKLFAAFGAWFGWQSLLPILLSASIMGSIVGLIYLGMSGKSKNTPIPFGPFLCMAGLSYFFIYT